MGILNSSYQFNADLIAINVGSDADGSSFVTLKRRDSGTISCVARAFVACRYMWLPVRSEIL